MLYAEASKADKDEYKFSVDYDVVRKEHVVLVYGKPASLAPSAKVPRVELARFLEPDRLVPITGVPAHLAEQETKGATTPIEKAKDIYEYVFRTMKYDKSGTGWGHGDTLWACDAKHGNCTDFHSVSSRWRVRRRFRHAFESASASGRQALRRDSRIPLLGRVLP